MTTPPTLSVHALYSGIGAKVPSKYGVYRDCKKHPTHNPDGLWRVAEFDTLEQANEYVRKHVQASSTTQPREA